MSEILEARIRELQSKLDDRTKYALVMQEGLRLAKEWLDCVYNNANSPKEEKAWAADAKAACVAFKAWCDRDGK